MLNKKLGLALLPLLTVGSLPLMADEAKKEESKSNELKTKFINGMEISLSYDYSFGKFGVGLELKPTFGFSGSYYEEVNKLFSSAQDLKQNDKKESKSDDKDQKKDQGKDGNNKKEDKKRLIFSLPVGVKFLFQPIEGLYTGVSLGAVLNFSDAISNRELKLDNNGKLDFAANSKVFSAVYINLIVEYYFTKFIGAYFNLGFNIASGNKITHSSSNSNQNSNNKKDDKKDNTALEYDFAKRGLISVALGISGKFSFGGSNIRIGVGYNGTLFKHSQRNFDLPTKIAEKFKDDEKLIDSLAIHYIDLNSIEDAKKNIKKIEDIFTEIKDIKDINNDKDASDLALKLSSIKEAYKDHELIYRSNGVNEELKKLSNHFVSDYNTKMKTQISQLEAMLKAYKDGKARK